MKRRFKVVGNLGRPRPGPGTFIIDTETGVATVKPLRSRREYPISLDLIAEIIVEKSIKADLREKAKAKAKKRGRG